LQSGGERSQQILVNQQLQFFWEEKKLRVKIITRAQVALFFGEFGCSGL